jgi:hypothetical protein
VTAFDEWHGKKPRALKKAERELRRAEKAYIHLESEIYKTPTNTSKGCEQKSAAPKSGDGMG